MGFHVRRLEALRRAGHVERIDEDHWRVPKISWTWPGLRPSQGSSVFASESSRPSTLSGRSPAMGRRLDRELVARDRLPITDKGFGDCNAALDRRADLAGMGHAMARNGKITVSQPAFLLNVRRSTASARRWRPRAGARPARQTGRICRGALVGSANLASGRFAMLETISGEGGLGFTLVPWQPVLDTASVSRSWVSSATAVGSIGVLAGSVGWDCDRPEVLSAGGDWAGPAPARQGWRFAPPLSRLKALTACRWPGGGSPCSQGCR